MGSQSSGTDTVTQKSEPWSQAQPYLTDIFGKARNLANQGAAYYPGSTVVPLHGDTEAGLQGLREKFQSGPIGMDAATSAVLNATDPTGAGANPFAADIRAAGASPTTAGVGLINQSAASNPFTADIRSATGRQNTAGADVLEQFASGDSNPFLDAAYDKAASKVRDNTAAMFSKAGRYGSEAHQGTLQEGLNDLATQMYGGAYESDAGRRMAAAEALGAREAGDISREISGASTLAGLSEAEAARKAGAGSTLAGLSQADKARELSSLGTLGGYGETAASRALQAVSMLPGLDAYSQTGDRGLIEIGGAREGQAAQELQDSIDRWQFGQNAGWDLLSRYNQIIQPIAGLGGTSTQTGPSARQSGASSAIQGGLGGAVAGSTFGPWGAAIGGGLGALGGIL